MKAKLSTYNPRYLFAILVLYLMHFSMQLSAAVPIPGTLQAEEYDAGGQGVAFNETTPTNLGGATYRNDEVDLQAASEGGYNVGYIDAGEWLKYTITVQQSGYYNITLRVASQTGTGSIRLQVDNADVTGSCIIPNTTGWQIWQNVKLSYINLSQGTHTLKIFFDGGGFNFNSIDFTLNAQAGSTANIMHTSGKNIVNENGLYVLKGVNLGNWMIQEGYMLNSASVANAQHQIRARIEALIGTAKTDQFYAAYRANWVSKRDIDSIAKWGFNHVRLPMHYNLFTPLDQADVYDERGFALVDSLVSWCKSNHIYLVLDMHATPGGQSDNGISDYDNTKPALWGSTANKTKLIKLWRVIAQRYANEPTIAGYDMINEPAWNLPGNTELKQLHVDMTASIRAVDKKHMLFTEGNWYANDFTAMTPPWDNNMVYSPHKYWNATDQGSIQWVLNIKNTYNVPLWFGEFGENSNEWNAATVKLYNDNGISWCIWPLKKLSTISSPFSAPNTAGWQALLNYWGGNGPQPSAAQAEAYLMDFAQKSNAIYCEVNTDYIDAILRAPYTNATVPFKTHTLPGTVSAVDYDMGRLNYAYYDTDYQNANGNGGVYNTGWTYRNDGVDIQWASGENTNTVGWTVAGEWMNYTVNAAVASKYTLNLRHAGNGGVVTIKVDGVTVLANIGLPSTGGYSTWATTTLGSFNLTAGKHTVQLLINTAGFNINYLRFTAPLSAALTAPTDNAVYTSPATINLSATVGGSNITKVDFYYGSTLIGTDNSSPYSFNWTNVAAGSYVLTARVTDNTNATATSNSITVTVKAPITQEPFNGKVASIPGIVQTEDYDLGGEGVAYHDADATNTGAVYRNDGVDVQATTDVNGGYNLGWTTADEWTEYTVNVTTAGTYNLNARVASTAVGKSFRVELDGQNIATIAVPNTGGWQTWQDVAVNNLNLMAGQKILRVYNVTDGFNLNYLNFTAAGTNVNIPPTVSVSIPTGPYTAPASVTINATAADADGTVSKVDFYNGTTLLGSDDTAPYSYSWTNISTGAYNVSAKATDDQGAVTSSASVSLVVNSVVVVNTPPTVSVSIPSGTYTAPATITFNATAADVDGVVTKVEFYNGSTLLGSDATSPYSFSWTNVAAGTYTITAKATDNATAVTTSSSASVTVVPPVVNNPCSNIAQYKENGGYAAGSKVQNGGKMYECKPWPYSGWCNGGAWAYAPGTGTAWADAWTQIGTCSSARMSSADNASAAVVSPNPTDGLLTVEFVEFTNAEVSISDIYGKEVLKAENVHSGSQLDLSSVSAGMYVIKISSEGSTYTYTVIKK